MRKNGVGPVFVKYVFLTQPQKQRIFQRFFRGQKEAKRSLPRGAISSLGVPRSRGSELGVPPLRGSEFAVPPLRGSSLRQRPAPRPAPPHGPPHAGAVAAATPPAGSNSAPAIARSFPRAAPAAMGRISSPRSALVFDSSSWISWPGLLRHAPPCPIWTTLPHSVTEDSLKIC
jgi:hypothetical protein